MKRAKKRVLIVEKTQTLRQQLDQLQSPPEYFSFVGFYKDARSAFLSLMKSRPEIIVLVIDEVDDRTLYTIGRIKNQFPAIKLLIQTDSEDETLLFHFLTVGLAGLASVSSTIEGLMHQLEEIDRGSYPTSRVLTKKIFESFQLNKFAELSMRQNEILRLMIMGATCTTIGERLGISRETAKTHMKNLYRKLRVHSKEEALSKAVEEKLVLVI